MPEPAADSRALFELPLIPIVDAHCHPMRSPTEALTVPGFERQISLGFMEHNQPGRARRPLVREWPTHTFPRPISPGPGL